MNNILNNLTDLQKELLEECLEGESIEDVGIENAKLFLDLFKSIEEYFSENKVISEKREEDFSKVKNYLNLLKDNEAI